MSVSWSERGSASSRRLFPTSHHFMPLRCILTRANAPSMPISHTGMRPLAPQRGRGDAVPRAPSHRPCPGQDVARSTRCAVPARRGATRCDQHRTCCYRRVRPGFRCAYYGASWADATAGPDWRPIRPCTTHRAERNVGPDGVSLTLARGCLGRSQAGADRRLLGADVVAAAAGAPRRPGGSGLSGSAAGGSAAGPPGGPSSGSTG